MIYSLELINTCTLNVVVSYRVCTLIHTCHTPMAESLLFTAAFESVKEVSHTPEDNERGHPQPMIEVVEELGEEDYQYEEEFEVRGFPVTIVTCTLY